MKARIVFPFLIYKFIASIIVLIGISDFNNESSLITIYYPVPDNFILKVHGVTISIDQQPFFFLKSGEHIRFFLTSGAHKIEVGCLSSYFDHKEMIDITTTKGQSIFLKTYPIFEGTTFIPYWFIPLPAPDIRFKLAKVDEDKAMVEISGEAVNPRKRILRK